MLLGTKTVKMRAAMMAKMMTECMYELMNVACRSNKQTQAAL